MTGLTKEKQYDTTLHYTLQSIVTGFIWYTEGLKRGDKYASYLPCRELTGYISGEYIACQISGNRQVYFDPDDGNIDSEDGHIALIVCLRSSE